MRRIALAACCLVALSPLSSCSSADTPPTSAGGSTAGDELAAARAFAALPPAEQTAQLQSVTESIDRQLMTMSGLEAELGGAAKADAAYAALSAKARQFAQSLVDQPDFGKFGAFVPAEDAPTTGGLMFANYMAGALLQDAAVNQAKDVPAGTKAEPQSEDLNDPNSAGKGAIKATGDMKQSSLEVGGEITVDGITGKLKAVITVAPCPDAKGQFTSTTTMTANVTSAGGSTGSNLTVEVAIKGQVDDDAQLASYDVDSRTQSAKFENSKGQFLDASVGWSVAGKNWSNYRGKVNRTGGAATEAFVADQSKWSLFTAIMMQDKALEAAKKGWQSGRCVTLEPTTQPGKRKGLAPSTSVTITAAPRSKIDGGPVGGTVTATLNGEASVSPAGSKVPADATFTYVAPSEKDKSATVSLEARSKRGVAKAELVFDTKAGAYALKGSIPSAPGGIRIKGQTCDVTKPFTAESSGDMIGTITFTPSDDSSGTVTFKGKVGNAPLKMSGKGKYTINIPPDADSGTLDWNWAVTIYIPVIGAKTTTGPASITMTPIAPC
jgi:hypothetical protein